MHQVSHRVLPTVKVAGDSATPDDNDDDDDDDETEDEDESKRRKKKTKSKRVKKSKWRADPAVALHATLSPKTLPFFFVPVPHPQGCSLFATLIRLSCSHVLDMIWS
jgi:hypothetical protein